ncbi:MAG: hypothetical protein O2955_16895 [Planctomycetota bacterium]|nr:hypothetical protein [Planctomycetota bacterium]MDA1214192.1 hypothetical protein [Planctomycetota bacterium]
MKTAISIPDDIFQSAELLAKRLGMTRSQVYVSALKQFLKEHREDGVTEKLNQVYGDRESHVDPVIKELQNRALPGDDWT